MGAAQYGGGPVSATPQSKTRSRRQRRLRKALVSSIGTGLAQQIDPGSDCKVDQGYAALLKAQLEVGSGLELQAAEGLRSRVWLFSKDKAGCRIVQDALRVAPRSLQDELIKELHNHVCDAIDSPHANFVVACIVEIMPVAQAAFVAKELANIAAQVARHRYGCRVLIRLLEHSACDPSTIYLVNEVLKEAQELIRHEFGRFVLEGVLEHGEPDQRDCVLVALSGHDNPQGMLRNALNRYASCVFERAMQVCPDRDKQAICRELLATRSSILQLAQNQFGCFVLKALLAYPSEQTQTALSVIKGASTELMRSRPGKKIVGLLDGGDFEDAQRPAGFVL